MELDKEQMDIFDGLLLSDGHLKKMKNNWNSRISFTVKHREFVEKIKNVLPFKWSEIKEAYVFDKRTKKSYHSCRLQSLSDIFFTEQRRRWYPSGKKIVPQDLIITPMVLMWWYLGDGYLRKKKVRPNYRRVELATDSFLEQELTFLINQLKCLLQDNNIYTENKEIMLSRSAITNFANVVGTISPVSIYQYKFDFGQYLDSDYLYKSNFTRRPGYVPGIRKLNNLRKKEMIK